MRRHIKDVEFAVDEHIWGHRLYDEQHPHLTVLEFLNVLCSSSVPPLGATPTTQVSYKPQRQIRLRSLLFNNPYIEVVRRRSTSSEEKWSEWMKLYAQNSTGMGDEDMEYLRRVFSSFDDFARAVELLRSATFEAGNKRWSSKFIFPFGPDALYEDLRIDASGNASNDRRFFARTGELLYLMLSRARRGRELGDQLVDRLFNPASPSPMNRLVRALQGEPQLAPDFRDVGYLPYSAHPRFERLCEDWLAILSRSMPVYDALEHLITSAGLNLLLYFLECGKSASGNADPVEIVCEIVSLDRTKVRSLSSESYQANQGYSAQAVRASIERIRTTPEWSAALACENPEAECARLLREQFQWPPMDEDSGFASMPGDRLVQALLDKAEDRHEQHLGKIHAAWSRAIGLSSSRLSRRTRYAPSDRLLKTLVVTIVDERMQLGEFLHEARLRYGLIIGDAEGGRFLRENQIDQEALSENREKLESRLLGLGLVRRLSDSCSFVENPFLA